MCSISVEYLSYHSGDNKYKCVCYLSAYMLAEAYIIPKTLHNSHEVKLIAFYFVRAFYITD